MARRWLLTLTGLTLCLVAASTAVAQDSTVHTLFGNWFGHKDNTQRQAGNRQMAEGNDGQSTRSQMDQMPPDPANGEVLPGLGGSPLPKKNGQTNNNISNSAIGKNGLVAPNVTQPLQPNGGQGYGHSSQNMRRSPSRQLNVSAPSVTLGTTSTSHNLTNSNASNAPTGPTRQSPSRRTAPHINPNDLRKELSGAFPNPVDTGDQPVARTARAAGASGGSISEPSAEKPKTAADTTPTFSAAKSSEQPRNDQPTVITDKPAHSSDASEEFKREPRSIESDSHNAAEAFGAKVETRSAIGSSRFVRTPYSSSPTAGPQTTRGKEAFGEALSVASGGDPNVLASNHTPVLNADIRGPKQILIGREAVYRVRLQNESDVPAEGIVATVQIPSGAEIINANATQGVVHQSQDANAKGTMQWQIAKLDRHAGETLEVRLVPRENRPLELGVTWTIAPVGSHAIVEVQEPKLQLELAGPSEVYFDRPQVFKLTISNPGTGPAENVKIELMPPGAKEGSSKEAVTSHPLGDLPPGGSQTVEVELTAREAGKLFVKAVAVAEGGLSSNASKEVFCRKPELEVDWRGPATKYAGTLATYFLRVRNPGTAPAEDVTVKCSLPEGAEFTSASEGQLFDTKTREISWRVGTLRPGDDNYMEVKCVLKKAGTNELKITAATAAGNLTDTKTASTNVVALADLKLDVSDPRGPVAVGSPALYEIHIRNRGANTAKDVNVVGLFSEGIEPEQAEGAMYTVADGRVSFKTVEELAAGREIVLRIRAHAVQPGTHIFRAEVLCRDLEIKLAAEETTRFYTDDAPAEGGSSDKQAGRSDAFKTNVR
jgi:uncharacterized repeat protein (TIGR01451 family)